MRPSAVLVAPWSGRGHRLSAALAVDLAERFRASLAAAGVGVLDPEALPSALGSGGWDERPDEGVLAAAAGRCGADAIVHGALVWGEEIRLSIEVWPLGAAGSAEGPPAEIWTVLDRAAAGVRAALGAEAASEASRPVLAALEALLEARTAWDAGDLDGVRSAVERARILEPGWEDPLEVLAGALTGAGEGLEASRIYADLADRARERRDGDRAAACLLDAARCRRAAGDLEATISLLAESAAEAVSPGAEVRARLLRSEFLRQVGRPAESLAEARVALSAARGLEPEESAVHFCLGIARAGDPPAAAASIGRAIEGFASAGDGDAVARAARSLPGFLDDEAAREVAAASVRRALGTLGEAVDPGLGALLAGWLAAAAARAARPELESEVAAWLTHLERIGDPMLLAEAWQKAAGWLEAHGSTGAAERYRNPGRRDPAPAADALEAARRARAQGRLEEAVLAACRGLALDPGCAPLLLERARAYRDLGREALAAVDLDRAVGGDPADPAARLERARTVAAEPEMFDCDVCMGAIADLSMAAADATLEAEACALAGLVHLRHFGDAERAREWLERSRRAGEHPAGDELEERLGLR